VSEELPDDRERNSALHEVARVRVPERVHRGPLLQPGAAGRRAGGCASLGQAHTPGRAQRLAHPEAHPASPPGRDATREASRWSERGTRLEPAGMNREVPHLKNPQDEGKSLTRTEASDIHILSCTGEASRAATPLTPWRHAGAQPGRDNFRVGMAYPVIIIERDADIREVLDEWFREAGHEVFATATLDGALRFLSDRREVLDASCREAGHEVFAAATLDEALSLLASASRPRVVLLGDMPGRGEWLASIDRLAGAHVVLLSD
jgi:hypothetical protein